MLTAAEILSLGEQLPPAPRILATIGTMLDDLDTDVAEIARCVRTDPALTARVVRMSNSVLFRGSAEIPDIEIALSRVGFGQVLRLVGAASLKQFATPLPLYGIDLDTFQQCSLCHALAAEHLAEAVGEDPRAAYLAALLRGLGLIVLDRAAEKHAPDARFHRGHDASYAEFERRIFGVTSVEITAFLLNEWKFPEVVVNAVHHHPMATSDALNYRMACVINVAGEIAAAAGRGLPGDEPQWTIAPEKYDVLGITYEGWEDLCAQATANFTDASAALAETGM